MSIDDTAPRSPVSVDEDRGPTSSLGTLLLVMAALAVIALGSFLASSGGEPPFEAEAALLIDQPQAIAAADGGEVLGKLSNLRLKYTGLVRTRALTEPIAEAVGASPDQVAGRISASAPPESLLIVVRASSAQRDAAVELADATSQALQDYVEQEHEREGIPPENRFVLTEVTPAEDAFVVDDSTRRQALRAAALLATLGLVVAPIVHVVRRRRDG